ncbi:MAG TPA: peptidase, partial [Candidatus Kapabacteria bacterium]|nr:peptidase [Candidatus Kapabacteria bacterium]
MAESKKKGGSPQPPRQEAETSPLNDLLSREELDRLSTLQLVDLISSKLPPRHSSLLDLVYLRERVNAIEEMNYQAQQALEKLDAVVEKLRSPAFRVGTLIMSIEPDKAHVCVGGTDYVCRIDPQIPLSSLQIGQRVLLNEAFAIVQGLGFDRNGPIVRIDDLLSDGRIRMGQDAGMSQTGIIRSSLLSQEKLKA